jgi:hypothetical protein
MRFSSDIENIVTDGQSGALKIFTVVYDNKYVESSSRLFTLEIKDDSPH